MQRSWLGLNPGGGPPTPAAARWGSGGVIAKLLMVDDGC